MGYDWAKAHRAARAADRKYRSYSQNQTRLHGYTTLEDAPSMELSTDLLQMADLFKAMLQVEIAQAKSLLPASFVQ